MPIILLHIRFFIILCRDDSVLVCIPMHHAVVSLALQWKQQIFACGSHQNENKQDDKASLFNFEMNCLLIIAVTLLFKIL